MSERPARADAPTQPRGTARRFVLRFDVDTHRCVAIGMPALLELGRRLDARFTFFVNMGRAIARGSALLRAGRSGPNGLVTAAKLPARRKLGLLGWLDAAVRNPLVGSGHLEVLRRAHAEGHEVGLHGGTNHALWQAQATAWDRRRLVRELDWALERLRPVLGRAPHGFASPGWTSPADLPDLLAERGVRYLADEHGPGAELLARWDRELPLPVARTHLTGEPGGVAWIEHQVALGRDRDAILSELEREVARAGTCLVAYDHPYFAGVEGLAHTEAVLRRARELGLECVPLERALDVGTP